MKIYTAVVERCPDTNLFVGYVPGFKGAHSQGETLEKLQKNLTQVIELLWESGQIEIETEFVGTQQITIL